jgi:HPt (histidine-containing phosphotransfer) domain-containing protein
MVPEHAGALLMNDDPNRPAIMDTQAALAQLAGDQRILQKVLDRFRESTPALLEEIRRAAAAGDETRLRISSHGLKGAAANICAEPTREAAARLEELAAAGGLSDIAPALAELEARLAELRRHLGATDAG